MSTADAKAIAAAVHAQRNAIETLFAQLRQDGLDEPGVSRDPYGAGEQRAHATVTRHAETLGLEISHDDAANLYMTLPGRDRDAPVLVIGSHLDSVPHGGNFDGAAGVLAGLALAPGLAQAEPPCGRGWRRDEWCGRHYRDRDYRGPIYRERIYVGPPRVIVAPPVYYAPPIGYARPQPGILPGVDTPLR